MADTLDISLTDAEYALVLTALHTHEQLARRQSGSPDLHTAERWKVELATTQALADRFHHKRSVFSISDELLAAMFEPVAGAGGLNATPVKESKSPPRSLMNEILAFVHETEVTVRRTGSDLYELQRWLESQTPPLPDVALNLVRSAMGRLDTISTY